MEFRLFLDSKLSANGDINEKQELRRVFHSQLKVLWNQLPLSGCHDLLSSNPGPGKTSILQPLGGFIFAPLVTSRIHLFCELDITLLRPGPPGSVITHSGDIDNRLKTLFDSLRMPGNLQEIPTGDVPQSGEDPFYCLLEDDILITKVSVTTDRLLKDLPRSPKEVLLIIHVTIKSIRAVWDNLGIA